MRQNNKFDAFFGEMDMELVFTANEMKRADSDTILHYGIDQMVLMERAALACKNEILRKWSGILTKGCKILIALGRGNNAGDGAALGRMLFLDGFQVMLWVDSEKDKFSEALQKQLMICEKYGVPILEDRQNISDQYDLVIDAIFGNGLSRDIEGKFAEKIGLLNQLGGIKVAVDIPSGIHADHGRVMGCSFQADMTVTFAGLKTGMLLQPGKTYCGDTVVCDIGIDVNHLLFQKTEGFTFHRDTDVRDLLAKRMQNSHKGTYGKALLIAGNEDTPGAALLATESLFRSGIGMVRLLAPGSIRDLILSVVPETMFSDRDRSYDLNGLVLWCDGIIIGPGLGKGVQQVSLLKELAYILKESKQEKKIPIVLDADAINILSEQSDLKSLYIDLARSGYPVVVTPHLEEMRRISGYAMVELKQSRMDCIREFCKETGFILICKDSSTVVATYEKGAFHYYINQTGNSGMATAGSGDVLSGIVGTCVIQDDAYMGAAKAVFIHGKAGDLAAEKYGERSMKPKDMMQAMIDLFNKGEKL